ncbi:MAG TPA: cysteine desulfurase family protein, partial [Longimicrobiales bacterium]|nr:cysteine desulfurase family protein [Longimicrobiales bacterium]
LDHAATTATRPEVREAMAPFLGECFGNPSRTHRYGRQARNALEQARERVAAALGAKRREIIFTGGGTEADNIAVLGSWRAHCQSAGAHGAVVCSAIEHKAVLAAARQAGEEGAELILLGVDEHGRVDVGAAEEALRAQPCIVSVMWGNNEVGSVQPIPEIVERCRSAGAVCHSDAVQAFGKVRVRLDEVPLDLLSVSAHKIGGPKGIGALYVREGVPVLALTHGGGQERDLRPGTENVASAVGFATAAELVAAEQETEAARLETLRERLEAGLRSRVTDLIVNGASRGWRLPHVLNVSVPGADQEALLIGLDLDGVAASGGSACQSGTVSASHVLAAMGRVRAGEASVRLSLGHETSEAEIDFAIDVFAEVVARIRAEAVL